jgi:hypothetical protein
MKIRLGQLCQPAALTLLLCFSAGSLLSQSNGEMKLSNQPPKARFMTLPPRLRTDLILAASVPLATWNGSFTYSGTKYSYNMVGSAPSSNTSTTVPVYIIPVKIVVTRRRTKTTFDPQHILSNGNTVVQNTVDSPLFDKTTTYTQGGTDVGTTQYIDAFQRANFWGTIKTHTNSHILLGGPTVTAEQTLSPPSQ